MCRIENIEKIFHICLALFAGIQKQWYNGKEAENLIAFYYPAINEQRNTHSKNPYGNNVKLFKPAWCICSVKAGSGGKNCHHTAVKAVAVKEGNFARKVIKAKGCTNKANKGYYFYKYTAILVKQ